MLPACCPQGPRRTDSAGRSCGGAVQFRFGASVFRVGGICGADGRLHTLRGTGDILRTAVLGLGNILERSKSDCYSLATCEEMQFPVAAVTHIKAANWVASNGGNLFSPCCGHWESETRCGQCHAPSEGATAGSFLSLLASWGRPGPCGSMPTSLLSLSRRHVTCSACLPLS